MKTSSFLRFVALFIVVSIFIQLVPVSAVESIREDLTADSSVTISEESESAVISSQEQKAAEDEEELSPGEVVKEDISKRQASVKHFLMDDGSYTAVDYGTTVHYHDGNQWKDIDNTLELSDGVYSNKENNFKVNFSDNISEDKLVSISKDNYSLSWQYVSSQNTQNKLRTNIKAEKIEKRETESALDVNSIENKSSLKKVKDGIKYQNIDTNVDIEYELGGNYVKENIVINGKMDSYSFGMQLFTENITPVLNSDGTVSFMANDTADTEVFSIPAPFMYDSAEAYSDAVTYSLQQIKGVWYLFVNADSTWINSTERVFPITVDPAVEETMTESTVTDVTLSSHSSYRNNTTLNSYGEIYVGYDPDYGQARALIHFDVPDSIPEEAYIFSATYVMVQNFYDSWDDSKPAFNILAYEADKRWHEDTSMQSWNGYYGSGSTTPVGEPFEYIVCGPLTLNGEAVYYGVSLDITEQMQRWLRDDGASNNGIMLVYENDTTGPYSYARFFTPETGNSNTEVKPRLQISYWDTTGLNDFNPYKAYTLENSGTIYINEASGSATCLYNDYTGNGARLSPVFNHVFNHIWVTLDGHVGQGFGMNIREFIEPVSASKAIYQQGYEYLWRDEDGSWVYFKKSEDGTKYIDEVGRGLTLTKTNDTYTIKDKSGNIHTYSYVNSGRTYLTKLEDSEGNILQIVYITGSDGLVDKVIDSASKEYDFTYSDKNDLISICNPAGDTICSYTYGDNHKLTAIHNYETGCNTYFKYDDHFRISTIANDYMSVRLEYNNNWQVTSLTEIAGSKENVLFTANYGTGTTEFIHQGKSYDVTAADAVREVCVFNEFGQKITSYLTSKDGSIIYGAATDKYTEVNIGIDATESQLKQNNKLVESNASYESVNYAQNPGFENGLSGWAKESSGASFTSEGVSTQDRYIGTSSLKLTADTALTGVSGYYQDIYLNPGTYVVSAYVKAVDFSGAFMLEVQGRSSTATVALAQDTYITSDTNPDINFGWQRVSASVTLTESGQFLRIKFVSAKGNTGTIYIDGVHVEKSSASGIYNFLENSGFEGSSGWTGSGTASGDGYSSVDKLADSQSYRIQGQVGKTASFSQTVNISSADTNPSTCFTLSGWAKAVSASIKKAYIENGTEKTKTPVFRMKAICIYSDGTESTAAEIDFNKFSSQWQYAEETFNVNQNGKMPVSIKVICEYSDNINSAYFDNIQLTHNTYVKTEYDEEGNVKRSENEKGETVEAEYDSESNVLTEIKDRNGVSTIYAYDSEKPHRLISITDYDANTYYEYDQYGNVTQSVVTENKLADYGIYLITAKTYKYSENSNNSQLALDYDVSNTKLNCWKQNRNGNQQFRLFPEGDGYYSMITVYPVGKTVTYSSGSITMGEYTGADTQLWKFEKDEEGAYRIIPKSDETKCLTVSSAAGAQAYLTDTAGKNEGSYFRLQMLTIDESLEYCQNTIDYTGSVMPYAPPEDGMTFFLNIKGKNLVITINSKNAGEMPVAAAFTGDSSQRLKLYASDTDGMYMIGPADNENFVLGVEETGVNGEYVVLQEKTGAENQLWCFEDISICYRITMTNDDYRISHYPTDSYKLKVSARYANFYIIPVDGTDDALQMGAKSEYTDSGMYVESVTDERGNVTTYDYNENTGKLNSSTDVKGNTYVYSYGADNDNESVYIDTDKDGVKDDGEVGVTYDFTNNRLTTLKGPSTEYIFGYNANGSMASTGTTSRVLAMYSYENDSLGRMSRLGYGNGQTVDYAYDMLGRITRVNYTNGQKSHYYQYSYDSRGNLAAVFDSEQMVTVKLLYDAEGKVYATKTNDGKQIYNNYDNMDRVTDITYQWDDDSYTYEYSYKTTSGEQYEIDSVTLPDGSVVSNEQDGFERITEKSIVKGDSTFTSKYSYLKGIENYTTNYVESMTMLDGTVYHYTYDESGNITSVTKNEETEPFVTYEYDELNQLIRENRKDLNKTWVMTYDKAGNISTKLEYAYTLDENPRYPSWTDYMSYSTGDWKDLMVSFDENITYDEIGNPLTYYNGMSFTWKDGRKLATVIDGTVTVKLEYDSDGLLVKKTWVDSVDENYVEETEYFYSGGVLQGIREYYTYIDVYTESEIWFLYDETGEITGFKRGAKTYYYSKNLQGDVLAILDETGAVVGTYTYDAWGKLIKVTDGNGNELTDDDAGRIAIFNPIRYRSYYYDTETGFYLTGTRYYDPEIGRFINADGQLNPQEGMTGYNLFQYCGNNPVNRIDPTGEAWWHWALGAAVVAACAVATVVTCGGFAAAAGAVAAVGSGVAAATTASTIAAGAFIGSATVYGMAVVSAASTSSSVKEFNDKGNWGTVAMTAGGAVVGGAGAYLNTKGSNSAPSTTKPKVTSTIKNDVIDLPRTGSALKTDPYHAFPNIVDNYAGYATKSPISNGTLYQLQGSLNGTVGRFEWIIQNQQVTHRMFVPGGGINGIPIMP